MWKFLSPEHCPTTRDYEGERGRGEGGEERGKEVGMKGARKSQRDRAVNTALTFSRRSLVVAERKNENTVSQSVLSCQCKPTVNQSTYSLR